MDLLIVILVIAFILLPGLKKNAGAKNKEKKEENTAWQSPTSSASQRGSAANRYGNAQAFANRTGSAQTRTTQARTTSSAYTSASTAKATPAAGQSSIVERAKANADRLKEDETLKEIERAHGHSEEEAHIEMDHSRRCQTLQEAEEMELAVENQLGTTEDLMIKGYSGNLSFERDFVGEAQDMLSRISQTPSGEIG